MHARIRSPRVWENIQIMNFENQPYGCVPTHDSGKFNCRDKRLHTRNRHHRYHRGFSVRFSNRCLVTFSDGSSLVRGSFQRIATFPVEYTDGCSVIFSNGISLLLILVRKLFAPKLRVWANHELARWSLEVLNTV